MNNEQWVGIVKCQLMWQLKWKSLVAAVAGSGRCLRSDLHLRTQTHTNTHTHSHTSTYKLTNTHITTLTRQTHTQCVTHIHMHAQNVSSAHFQFPMLFQVMQFYCSLKNKVIHPLLTSFQSIWGLKSVFLFVCFANVSEALDFRFIANAHFFYFIIH